MESSLQGGKSKKVGGQDGGMHRQEMWWARPQQADSRADFSDQRPLTAGLQADDAPKANCGYTKKPVVRAAVPGFGWRVAP